MRSSVPLAIVGSPGSWTMLPVRGSSAQNVTVTVPSGAPAITPPPPPSPLSSVHPPEPVGFLPVSSSRATTHVLGGPPRSRAVKPHQRLPGSPIGGGWLHTCLSSTRGSPDAAGGARSATAPTTSSSCGTVRSSVRLPSFIRRCTMGQPSRTTTEDQATRPGAGGWSRPDTREPCGSVRAGERRSAASAALRLLGAGRQTELPDLRIPARAPNDVAAHEPDVAALGDANLEDRSTLQARLLHLGALDAERRPRLPDLDPAALERAPAALAPKFHAAAGDRTQDHELGEVERIEAPGAANGRAQAWERSIAAGAVLVDLVTGDVLGAVVNRRVGVVAVSRPVFAVAIAIRVDRVDAVAVLVDPVVRYVGETVPDGRIAVVAVRRGGLAVVVGVGIDGEVDLRRDGTDREELVVRSERAHLNDERAGRHAERHPGQASRVAGEGRAAASRVDGDDGVARLGGRREHGIAERRRRPLEPHGGGVRSRSAAQGLAALLAGPRVVDG